MVTSGLGRTCVSRDEEYFNQHFFEEPLLPSPFLKPLNNVDWTVDAEGKEARGDRENGGLEEEDEEEYLLNF